MTPAAAVDSDIDSVRVIVPGRVDRAADTIQCVCGHTIYRRGVVYARAVDAVCGQARCTRCRRWMPVPVRLA